jgi:uncharacterized Zn finger protein
MSWEYGYYSQPTVAEQKRKAEKQLAKLRKKDPELRPVLINGSKFAKTWWGLAWCKNLERYADYENRIGRGRSYVKNGLVLDLKIAAGQINALVSGSSVYNVAITIDKLPDAKWKKISEYCAERIDSMEALAQGSFPKDFQEIFMQQESGLFPSLKEIHMECSCPDWATMCKHVAAALLAVGARLDAEPLIFFTLRGVDPAGLIKRSVEEKMKLLLKNAQKAEEKSERIISEQDSKRIFDLYF